MHYNAQMNAKQLRSFCRFHDKNSAMIELMSAIHAETIQYRSLDREGWMG